MNHKIRLVGLTLGDPFSRSSWSGINNSVFCRFKDRCEIVALLDLDLQGFNKYWSALKNFSIERRRWGNKLHQNPWAFKVRTEMAIRKLKEISSEFDLIYQEGAMFMPGEEPCVPFVSYHDSNVILSSRGGVFAQGSHYGGKKFNQTIAQEKRVYENAALIFSMSDWLKRSFVHDFNIPEGKIITVYAGTNLEITDFEKDYDGKTILFVGKNFERKGGETLLKAFRIVKREIKDAKLIIIGPELNMNDDGISVKGLITDKDELIKNFKEASVFVLPSFYEPFGIVFAEAFALKNPCIGSNICAMPEIIEEGKGGFLVKPGDYKYLATQIITLLKDEKLSRTMGSYGYEKVKKIFNWNIVVDKMLYHCSKIV